MSKDFDVKDVSGEKWLYSKKVEQHFFHPKNVMLNKMSEDNFDAFGEVGSMACGDVMRVWIKVNPKGIITDCKWRTFGCASAIATTSMMSTMVIGKSLDEAYLITPQMIVENLGGLPKRKIHCSVLGDQALRKAIDNYRSIVSYGRN